MDGVSMVSQCAVLPSSSFTYRFIAMPAGTHAWSVLPNCLNEHAPVVSDGVFPRMAFESMHLRAKEPQGARLCVQCHDVHALLATLVLFRVSTPGASHRALPAPLLCC
jgi:hypothetical protein